MKLAQKNHRSQPAAILSQRRRNKIRRSTPEGNINNTIGRRIKAALGSERRGQKWEALVGYTKLQLKNHIERQFGKGMSWTNRYRWHIDHIVPLSSFKFTSVYDEEFKAAWALSNLRPLWKEKNLAKGSKREFLL